MNRAEGIVIFEQRWEEAKASGCKGVLFERDKWTLIDMLVDEAKRAQNLRRALIEALERIRDMESGEKDDGELGEAKADHRGAARAA